MSVNTMFNTHIQHTQWMIKVQDVKSYTHKIYFEKRYQTSVTLDTHTVFPFLDKTYFTHGYVLCLPSTQIHTLNLHPS